MDRDEYLQAIKRAESDLANSEVELAEIEEKKMEIGKRIRNLNETIGALSSLIDVKKQTKITELGLTGACRELLRSSHTAMTAAQLKEALDALGYDMSTYQKPLKAIRTVLNRLHAGKEIDGEGPEGSEKAAIWIKK